VHAAVDGVTLFAATNDGGEIEMLALFIGNSCSLGGPAALLARFVVHDVSSAKLYATRVSKIIQRMKSMT
jgi:hypothetical protein